MLFGDASTILAALPAILIDLDYSRAMEREADLFALDLLRANGISTGSLATLFERMQAVHEKKGDERVAGLLVDTPPDTGAHRVI